MANCVVHSKLPFGQTLVSTGKKYILGIYLIALSCIMYGGVIIVLFIPFTAQIKITLTIILAIIGEVAGWIGAFILGKDVFLRYRSFLNPFYWFRQKKQNQDQRQNNKK